MTTAWEEVFPKDGRWIHEAGVGVEQVQSVATPPASLMGEVGVSPRKRLRTKTSMKDIVEQFLPSEGCVALSSRDDIEKNARETQSLLADEILEEGTQQRMRLHVPRFGNPEETACDPLPLQIFSEPAVCGKRAGSDGPASTWDKSPVGKSTNENVPTCHMGLTSTASKDSLEAADVPDSFRPMPQSDEGGAGPPTGGEPAKAFFETLAANVVMDDSGADVFDASPTNAPLVIENEEHSGALAAAAGLGLAVAIGAAASCRRHPEWEGILEQAEGRDRGLAAAEGRKQEQQIRRIGNIAKVNEMGNASSDARAFGVNARDRLRAALEKSREALQAQGAAEPSTADPDKIGGQCACTAAAHLCSFDLEDGCPSCFQTCHADCTSHLCRYSACAMCLSMSVAAHVGSDLCKEVQCRSGCHSCGQQGCWISSSACPARVQAETDDIQLIHFEGEKPRAFYNALHEVGGAGSCWINAALQALLNPPAFKRILEQLWCETSSPTRAQLHQISGVHRRIAAAVVEAPPLLNHQDRLSATLCAAHTAPRTEAMTPYLFTDVFYEGVQDDAAELISRLLHPTEAPLLFEAVRGRMDQFLECTNLACKHSRPTEGERFASLQLPLRTLEGVCVQSVQEAVDAYMPPEIVHIREPCAHCGSTEFLKTHAVVHWPKVLIIFLNRWDGHGAAIIHSIEASTTLNFKGAAYNLCATVCHLGPAPDAGHYVALAWHATNHGEWWLYDDARRTIATDQQVTTLCGYRHWGPMQCYVLIYERWQ